MKFIIKMYRFLITFCRSRTTKYISPLTYFTLFKIQEKIGKVSKMGPHKSPKSIQNGVWGPLKNLRNNHYKK